MKIKLYESRVWLKRQYITLGLTEEEIAQKAGVNQSTINRWLRIYKLKRTR